MIENNGDKKVALSYEELIDIAQNFRKMRESYEALKTKCAKLESEIKKLKNNGSNGNSSKSRILELNGNGREYKDLNEYIKDESVPLAERKRVYAKIMRKRYGIIWFYIRPELAQVYNSIK